MPNSMLHLLQYAMDNPCQMVYQLATDTPVISTVTL